MGERRLEADGAGCDGDEGRCTGPAPSTTVSEGRLVAAGLLAREMGAVAADWRELCRWDPELEPGAVTPPVEPVIAAVAGALQRPQPLGWGADEDVADAVDAFTDRAGPAAVEELICLREVLTRRLRGRVPPNEGVETWARLQMTIDRAMARATRRAFAQLQRAACFDALTGVMNRRSFEADAAREIGRVARHGGRFSLGMLDLDGLKAINDTLGHAAGDARLRALGTALRTTTRREDSAYRIGGDEFAVLLPGASADQARRVLARVGQAAGLARFSWGVATCPADGITLEALAGAADARLYRRRAAARRAAPGSAAARRAAARSADR
ncbi:MAG TPA: GGDEF domain-containing protein [Acidimicrobiia bacterium]|nr:GGDEF domain-containing protein [Acidimicrobiia bacterium]